MSDGNDDGKLAILEGWLLKRGKINPAFKRRYCRIKSHILFYYTDETAVTANGRIDLRASELKEGRALFTPLDKVEDEMHSFNLVTSENRTYVFKANSADDLKNWVDAIKKTKKTEIMIKNLENKISSLKAQNSNMMKQFQLEIKLLIEQQEKSRLTWEEERRMLGDKVGALERQLGETRNQMGANLSRLLDHLVNKIPGIAENKEGFNYGLSAKSDGVYWKTITNPTVYFTIYKPPIKDIAFQDEEEYFDHRVRQGFRRDWTGIIEIDDSSLDPSLKKENEDGKTIEGDPEESSPAERHISAEMKGGGDSKHERDMRIGPTSSPPPAPA